MVASRPFAYNPIPPNSLIFGTTQVGDLAIGNINEQYADNYGGVKWWNGPEEASGYVIAVPVSGNTQPTPDFGVYASVGFYRSKQLTDPSFLEISDYLGRKQGQPPFANTQEAYDWLTAQGYWTSFVPPNITPTPTPTPTGTPVSATPTPSVTNTPTGTPASTPTPTPTHSAPSGFTISIVESGGNVVMSASGSLNINDLTLITPSTGPLGGAGIGISTATFIIGSNGQNYAEYSGFTSTPSNFGTGGGGSSSSSSGDVIGVIVNGVPPYILTVPVGYTTGTAISSTQTFNGQTFSSLGLTPGTYTYTWGSGANADSINVVVGASITPTPTATSATPTPTPTSGATGDFTVTVSQQGPDVVWNGSGKFNLTALTSNGTNTIGGGFQANQAIWAIGPTVTVDTYSGTISYPTSFGGNGVGVTSNTGSTFGILPGGSGRLLYVPAGYTSNTTISGSSTYANNTISGMGLTPGTYTWSWGSGGTASTLVMTISS